jgi:methionyl aminopeptidase
VIRLKTDKDLEGIRKSCLVLRRTFIMLEPHVKAGMSGLELDRLATEFIRKQGAKPAFLGYEGFPNALCVSMNDAVIHGIPNKQPFKEGDLVGIDCGVDLGGYISDAAHTYAIGAVSERISLLMRTAEESLYLGIKEARAGNRIHDISRAVYRHNKREGFGIVRPYCGHGVGFAVHEEPQVPNYVGTGANPRLKPGMVIAIEPMVNLGGDGVHVANDGWTVLTNDHLPSAHYEHTVAITEGDPYVLTQFSPEELA